MRRAGGEDHVRLRHSRGRWFLLVGVAAVVCLGVDQAQLVGERSTTATAAGSH